VIHSAIYDANQEKKAMSEQPTDSNDPKESLPLWRRLVVNRWLIAGVAAVVLYTLFGFLLAPWLVKYYAKNYAEEKLKRHVSIADVRINPFLFTFEAKGFTLREADNRPIVGFNRLFVDFELSSLFRWAWTFADIRIERPSLNIEIQPNGRLNFADLADSLPKSKDTSNKAHSPPRLLLQHAEIVDGNFTFSDRSVPTPATETFTPLNLELKEISTLPERKGPYTIQAKLPGGGTIGWRGKVSLNPLFSEGELSAAGFKLATAWKFVQDAVHLASPAGEVDFSSRYRFNYQKHVPLLVLQDANLALKKLLLTEKGKNTPMLALEAIEASGMHFDLQQHELSVSNITIRDGKIAASVDEKGLLSWQKLIAHRKSANAAPLIPAASTPDRQPWRLKAKAVKIENVAVNYIDRSRATPLGMTIGALNTSLNASAEIGNGPVKANMDGITVNLNRVALSKAGQDIPLFTLDTLSLEDGHIDIGNREIMLTRISTTGGKTSVVRDKNGRVQLVEMLTPGDKGMLKRKISETGTKAQAEGRPWSFRLNDFELNGFSVALKDRTFVPDIGYELKDIRVSLKNLTNDKKTPIDFNAALKVAQGGNARISGQASQTGDRVDARAKIKDINLKPLHPAVTKFTFLTLESGNISASIHVDYHSLKSGPRLRAAGSMSLNKLGLNEAETGERFLGWKAMSAKGIKFSLSPRRLKIDELRLLELGAKVMIFKDRSTNLAKVLKTSDSAGTETKPHPEKVPPAGLKDRQELFPINIERIRVDNGSVNFADLSLVLPFAAQVTDFNGGITGISSDNSRLASLLFKGKVDQYGFSKVEGRLNPFLPKKFTDITVLFRNVRMQPFSPYTATFAGRKISSGTLNLNLEYKIKNSELLGNNSVVLDKFTLGERVKSPNAINLPLDLAIALLTDADGKIDVAVPVRGNVDDPKFSYGRVIWKAITNLITKIATAPFRALGHLFGGKGEQLAAIAFDPGSAHLLPPEMEKIKKISEALKKRPQLKLVVAGRFDPQSDGKALRTARVKRALAVETGVKLAPGEKPGPISFDTAKMQGALEKMLTKRNGDDAVSKFVTQYEKETGKKAKPMNFAMALVGWKSSDTAFYKAMFNELVKLEPLTDNDLIQLARKRAKEVVNQVRAAGQLEDTRVVAGNPGPVKKASGEAINLDLSLEVIKPAA
jgi:uncharacterized protein involved in outer membrane biogenesis